MLHAGSACFVFEDGTLFSKKVAVKLRAWHEEAH